MTTPSSPLRFGLRDVLTMLTALAVVLCVCAQIPRPILYEAASNAPALIFFAALFALVPLACINLVVSAGAWFLASIEKGGSGSSGLRWWAPHRLLSQSAAAEPPSLPMAAFIAMASTSMVSLLWPLLRELGLGVAIWFSFGNSQAWRLFEGLPQLLTDTSYLRRLITWELWSVLRWWLLFGTCTAVWAAIRWTLRWRWPLASAPNYGRRLLAFAPWIVVLEIAFLIGVWIVSPLTVPEPSTGFVEGIFSWDRWHWDCWKGKFWIVRGLVPLLIVGPVFFRQVLGWRWSYAAAGAACLVPPALALSVAWTVLFRDLF